MTKKQQKELFVFDKFKELYNDFPSGTFSIGIEPMPDFVLTTTDNTKIGIEITEAVIDEKEVEVSSFKNRITNLVLSKLESLLPFKFNITVRQYRNKKIPSSSIKILVDEVVQICAKEAIRLKNNETVLLENFEKKINSLPPFIQQRLLADGYRNLPFGIKSVKIDRMDCVDKSWNSRSEAIWVPNFTQKKLESILSKKEKKKYSGCDQYWLVIWESGFAQSYYKDISIYPPIDSSFDRVFLARTFKNIIVVLKG